MPFFYPLRSHLHDRIPDIFSFLIVNCLFNYSLVYNYTSSADHLQPRKITTGSRTTPHPLDVFIFYFIFDSQTRQSYTQLFIAAIIPSPTTFKKNLAPRGLSINLSAAPPYRWQCLPRQPPPSPPSIDPCRRRMQKSSMIWIRRLLLPNPRMFFNSAPITSTKSSRSSEFDF